MQAVLTKNRRSIVPDWYHKYVHENCLIEELNRDLNHMFMVCQKRHNNNVLSLLMSLWIHILVNGMPEKNV